MVDDETGTAARGLSTPRPAGVAERTFMNAYADRNVRTVERTRRALHGVAELVLAGPQYRRRGSIQLRVVPGGFATSEEPDLRLEGSELVVVGRRLPLSGRTCAELAEEAGVDVGAPGVYADGSDVTADERLEADADAARWIADCYAVGEEAMRRLAPAEDPVLWPEHFDVGISLDEVNYGVSPGDSTHPEPYAYVGPWRLRTGDFWNAPFGAARPMRTLVSADAALAFFAEGRLRAAEDPIRT